MACTAGSLTRELHVLPYFHGNRSPRADPTLRGGISGLKLSDTVDSLALLYLATIQAMRNIGAQLQWRNALTQPRLSGWSHACSRPRSW